jgi:hypothetical protein
LNYSASNAFNDKSTIDFDNDALSDDFACFMNQVFINEIDADVTIKVGDKFFKAHKAILKRTEIFLPSANLNHNVIDLNESNIEYDIAYQMVQFLYSDHVQDIGKDPLKLMIAAHRFNVLLLTEICKDYLKSNLDCSNVILTLLAADQMANGRDLKDAAIAFVVK